MDMKKAYMDALHGTNQIALATMTENGPNVRVVNFCFRAEQPGVLYFASDRENQKVSEMRADARVAITTIPPEGQSVSHVRAQGAIAKRSKHSILDMKALFIERTPGYDETIAAIGDTLDVYEIHIEQALVIADFENAGTVAL